jgi:hypothetical protein
MQVVEMSTVLEATADAVWNAVKTPTAFRKVTRGLLTMPVINKRRDEWHEGETVIGWVFLFGFIPFSHHHLYIAKIDEKARTLSSREQGGLVKRWDHDIIVTQVSPEICSYRDRIDIDAGVVTPVVVLYARFFYRIRQRRWRALAKGMS